MFLTKLVENIKTHIVCSITPPPKKMCPLYDVEKYGTARQATDDNVRGPMCFAYGMVHNQVPVIHQIGIWPVRGTEISRAFWQTQVSIFKVNESWGFITALKQKLQWVVFGK
jgi:hypothetical protein